MQSIVYILIGMLILIIVLVALIFCIRTINAKKNKITSENGIQQNLYVDIGKIQQYLQIRGEDDNNPVILFLHGGPCNPNAYIAPYYQKSLEKNFTIVNWDQRGCGRTFYANPDMDYNKEISINILINDIDEIVTYLSSRFRQEKVIIMGHSWGTVLGTQYCLKYPEKVNAYIGIGQCISVMKGEELAVNKAIDTAQANNNIQDLKKMKDLWKAVSQQKKMSLEFVTDFITMRKLIAKYLSCNDDMPLFKTMWLYLTSSEMSLTDIKFFFKINNFKNRLKYASMLDEYVFYEFDLQQYSSDYQVPVYFISGESDCIPPLTVVEEYLDSITAPDKGMFLVEKAGHIPFLDNAEAFCGIVLKILKAV